MGITLKERNTEIYQRWKSGEPMQSIADAYGITRQRIYKIIEDVDNDTLSPKQMELIEDIVFPEIKEYLIKNKLPIAQFCDKVVSGSSEKAYSTRRFLMGYIDRVPVYVIKRILKEINATFEEVFG